MKLTGHVEKRRKNSWLLVVEYPPDESGRRKRATRSVKVDTKKEAKAELRRWLAFLEETQTLPSHITLEAWLERWMKERVTPNRAPKTVVGYRNSIDHVLPALGRIELQSLSGADVQSWLTSLREAGEIKARTQQYAFAVLRKSLNDAVRLGLLAYNPCLRVDSPKPEKQQVDVLQPEELQLLIASASKDIKLIINTAALTGMRLGELLGLHWEDVNLEEGWLQVQRALQRVEGKYVLREPKYDSRRRIALPPSLVAAFKEHKIEQDALRLKVGPGWQNLDLVFCRGDGYYLHPSTVYHQLKRLCVRVLDKPCNPHLLRHTHATMLLRLGVHPKVVQYRLGHAHLATTMDLYTHMIPSLDQEAAVRVDKLLKEKEQDSEKNRLGASSRPQTAQTTQNHTAMPTA